MKFLKCLALSVILVTPALADEQIVADAVIDYMDFATETSGIILAEQMDAVVFKAATFIDVRSAEEFAAEHIPGAMNIEWRALPARLDEVPVDGMVLFYCNTGMRSAQVTFAARLLGRENVLVIQGGMQEWQNSAAYKP